MRTKKTRTDWVCYFCGITEGVVKKRVMITSTTSECVYLCRADLPRMIEVITLLRG